MGRRSASSDAELDAALDRYDHDRQPRTQQLVRSSARVGRIAQARHPVLATARNVAASLVPARAYLAASAGAFSWTPPDTRRPERP